MHKLSNSVPNESIINSLCCFLQSCRRWAKQENFFSLCSLPKKRIFPNQIFFKIWSFLFTSHSRKNYGRTRWTSENPLFSIIAIGKKPLTNVLVDLETKQQSIPFRMVSKHFKKIGNIPLCIVVSYTHLVFSQLPAHLHQVRYRRIPFS